MLKRALCALTRRPAQRLVEHDMIAIMFKCRGHSPGIDIFFLRKARLFMTCDNSVVSICTVEDKMIFFSLFVVIFMLLNVRSNTGNALCYLKPLSCELSEKWWGARA